MLNAIHTCKTMTVRQYSLFESGEAKALQRYKWIPVSWFPDDRAAFVQEFTELFNSDNDVLDKSWEQLNDQNQIMLMQALAEAIYTHTVTRIEMKLIAEKVGYQMKDDNQLTWYLERVKEITGTELKTLDDIVVFRNEVQRKIDKYNQKYTRPIKEKSTTILELFTACCRIMEVTHDYTRMTLWEFAQFKRQAEDHSRRLEAVYNKNKAE